MAKTICLRCHGNGYIKVMDSMENQHQIETIYQCPQCNSQGEVMIDEPRFKNIQRERYLLSVAHIKNLKKK
jgi:DnaJ-class molecular chaperone